MTAGAGLGTGLVQAGEWGNEKRKAELIQKFALERMDREQQMGMQRMATEFEYNKALQDDLYKKKSLLAGAKGSGKYTESQRKADQSAAEMDPTNMAFYQKQADALDELWREMKKTPNIKEVDREGVKRMADAYRACVGTGNYMSPECGRAHQIHSGGTPGDTFAEIFGAKPTPAEGSEMPLGGYKIPFTAAEKTGEPGLDMRDLAAFQDAAAGVETEEDTDEEGFWPPKTVGTRRGRRGANVNRADWDERLKNIQKALGTERPSSGGRNAPRSVEQTPLTDLFGPDTVASGGTAPMATDGGTGLLGRASGGTAPEAVGNIEEYEILREARARLDAGDATGAYKMLYALRTRTQDQATRLIAIRMITEATKMGLR